MHTLQVIPLPSFQTEQEPLTASCSGCVKIAKCGDSDADIGCKMYRPLASSYTKLPEAVYLTLVNSRMRAGEPYSTDSLTAIGNMFFRAALIQRKLENIDYPLAILTPYYLRITGVGAYIMNYRRVVLVDAYPRDRELFLVFIDQKLERAYTVPAPRKLRFKRPVDSEYGQQIYSLDEWSCAKEDMLAADRLVDPWLIENARRALVRKESDRMVALLGTTSNKKSPERDVEIAQIMGSLDEDLLSALVGERKADEDYPGKSDALTAEELEQQADAILSADESDADDGEEETDEELEQLTDLFRED